jgi:hypothetical protein
VKTATCWGSCSGIKLEDHKLWYWDAESQTHAQLSVLIINTRATVYNQDSPAFNALIKAGSVEVLLSYLGNRTFVPSPFVDNSFTCVPSMQRFELEDLASAESRLETLQDLEY